MVSFSIFVDTVSGSITLTNNGTLTTGVLGLTDLPTGPCTLYFGGLNNNAAAYTYQGDFSNIKINPGGYTANVSPVFLKN